MHDAYLHTVTHTKNRTVLSHEEKGNLAICDNRDGLNELSQTKTNTARCHLHVEAGGKKKNLKSQKLK